MNQTSESPKGNSSKREFYSFLSIMLLFALLLTTACVESDITNDVSPSPSPTKSDVAKVDDWQYQDGVTAPPTPPTPPTTPPTPPTLPPISTAGKIDDWQYDPSASIAAIVAPSVATTPAPIPMAPSGKFTMDAAAEAAMGSSSNIGFSVGGAKDINNFRENIKNGYLPLPTDVTYEGLFYDYYFDTGNSGECDSLFCPSYTYAVTEDPFSGEKEYYLAVGLNSGMKESDFARKKLNLVIVLDISGSMGSPFDRYYYDGMGNMIEKEGSEEDFRKTKMEIANEAVVALLGHLEDDDRFGMVLFNDGAYLAKPMNLVAETDMEAIEDHILDITAGGSTNMAAGMQVGTDLFDELLDINQSEYENRIIFLTDAMPNTGDTSEHGLIGMTENNAEDQLHTTFIGIGVDFNTELIEHITKIRGANYYSVHSANQFQERMDDEFEYMVTPLVFDLELVLETRGWEIEAVYGSPEADEATGELMKVNTLFPSKTVGGETKGGLVLLKLNRTSSNNNLILKVSYDDRNGKSDSSETSIDLENEPPEFFDNTGIRKGVLLSRYADLLINWIIDEREHDNWIEPWKPVIDHEIGICMPPLPDTFLGRWERQSTPLTVSEEYEDLFEEFSNYFRAEMQAIDDDTLDQELDILYELT